AHAIDSPWPMYATSDGSVLVDAQDVAERTSHCERCLSALDLAEIPALIDDMDDAANLAYEAWPDRLLLIDLDGRVAYRSAPGPFGFDPESFAAAIRKERARLEKSGKIEG